MSMPIHVEVWLVAVSLTLAGEDVFSAEELISHVFTRFQDARPGVYTHVSSHCNASAKRSAGTVHNYLYRVSRGQYRLCRASDVVHPSRIGFGVCPDEDLIDPQYRELWNQGCQLVMA